MKKSNIILVSAIFMAFVWTLLIGWFAASAINNYLQGKDPYFARTYSQNMESKKKNFPVPANELCISGEGTAMITILPGKELTILSEPRIWNFVCTDLGNGKSKITFKKLSEYNDPVTITVPEIPDLSLDNFSEVTIKGLNLKKIHVHCVRVSSFTISSCKIGKLSLDFPRTRDQQDIYIDKSNQIDSLTASVRGSGRIRLETAGQLKNQFSLSDSVKVEATYDLMKKLSIGQESRVMSK
jgi:hypothetical protein